MIDILKRVATVLAALGVLFFVPGKTFAAEPFTFVALGDTTYEPAEDDAVYQDLITLINSRHPAFSIHVGDTKGFGDCGTEFQEKEKARFNTYESAVIYTPGNNEWADCWRKENMEGNPVEILKLVRTTFFSTNMSLGKNPIPLERESDDPAFSDISENAMWEKNGILFATLHLVGSGNNLVAINEEMFNEFLARDLANEAWINKAFARVEEEGLEGVVFAFHSNIFDDNPVYRAGPFERVRNALRAGIAGTTAKVLVINGHYHELVIDTPWQVQDFASNSYTFGNLTRLQVPGWPQHKAVEVTVEPGTPWLWSFKPVFNADFLSPGFLPSDMEEDE